MTMFWAITNALATFVMALSAAYFFLNVGMGISQLRRDNTTLGYQSHFTYGRPFAPVPDKTMVPGYVTYFMVACLNEEAGIASTVAGLRHPDGHARIIVIDDGSDDRTATLACEAGQGQVILVRRELPDARKGKDAALNAGFARIVADVADQGLAPDKVIVCVMDADGQLSEGAMTEVLPVFEDPEIGGVQLAVRIRNRTTNFLLSFQDYQFWSQSALTQFGRMRRDTHHRSWVPYPLVGRRRKRRHPCQPAQHDHVHTDSYRRHDWTRLYSGDAEDLTDRTRDSSSPDPLVGYGTKHRAGRLGRLFKVSRRIHRPMDHCLCCYRPGRHSSDGAGPRRHPPRLPCEHHVTIPGLRCRHPRNGLHPRHSRLGSVVPLHSGVDHTGSRFLRRGLH
jgi:hypothetical protein